MRVCCFFLTVVGTRIRPMDRFNVFVFIMLPLLIGARNITISVSLCECIFFTFIS